MAGTPDTFTGLYARPTAVLPGPDGGGAYYATEMYLECYYVNGLNGMTRVATIPFTMPTGCVAFQDSWVRFDDAGYMYTATQAAKYPNFSAAGSDTNWSREVIAKYRIADDGTNQKLWEVQTPFSAGGNMSGYITIAPDGSWGALFGLLPINCGTGEITYPSPQLIDSPDDPGNLVYPAQYRYVAAGYGSTLVRQKIYQYEPFRFKNPKPEWGLSDSIYALVTFDGTVVSQADWDTLGWKTNSQIVGWALNRAVPDYFSVVTLVYANDQSGTTFDQQEYILDPATCLPSNPGPRAYARDGSTAGDLWAERLPGGGRRFDHTGGDWYIPWKASATGAFEPAVASGAVQLGKNLGVSHNGLVVNDQAAPDNFPTSYDQFLTTFTYGFIDTDGRYGEHAGGDSLLHQPAIGIWDFRPNLPADSITAGIDSTRRLFTAV